MIGCERRLRNTAIRRWPKRLAGVSRRALWRLHGCLVAALTVHDHAHTLAPNAGIGVKESREPFTASLKKWLSEVDGAAPKAVTKDGPPNSLAAFRNAHTIPSRRRRIRKAADNETSSRPPGSSWRGARRIGARSGSDHRRTGRRDCPSRNDTSNVRAWWRVGCGEATGRR